MNKLLTKKYFPYVIISPVIILFSAMFIYPVINSIWLSFHINRGETMTWNGLSNYNRLIHDPIWWRSLINIAEILLIHLPVKLLLALLLALALNSNLVRIRSTFRICYFLPAITSLVAYSLVFLMLFDNRGFINNFLGFFGISPIYWLIEPVPAKASIIIATTWRWTGYTMIIFLAALQDIPISLYEAATIDGASKWHQFRYITIPLLKPVILFTTIMTTIGTFQLFDEPFNLTNGGPVDATMTPTLLLYNTFVSFEIGYSSAIAYGIVFVIGIIAMIQFKILGKSNY